MVFGKFRSFLILMLLCCLCCTCLPAGAVFAAQNEEAVRDAAAAPADLKLHAKSAVLLDGDSGRVLYEKNGEEQMPMASTTKIMTCILALEFGDLSDQVTVSAKASAMPKVRLGMVENEQFYLKDLLYSMMLESHNDSAAAIAEHVAGSLEAFGAMMNQKARDLGCYDTYFVTPNGLDGAVTDQQGNVHEHHTTAADLARILRYCIRESTKKEEFLEITGTSAYSFSNVKGTRNFSCRNHNAFLQMMEGALTGKTGFTAKAGYCYVGALERDGKTLIVALLACGWPNNRTYKWEDTRTLMKFGLEQFEYRELEKQTEFQKIPVENGVPGPDDPNDNAYVSLRADYGGEQPLRMLLGKDERVRAEVTLKPSLKAPVKKNTVAGKVQYLLDDQVVLEFPVLTDEDVAKRSPGWSIQTVLRQFLSFHSPADAA